MININDYTYHLPQEKIALFPLPERDASKLLVYRRGSIEHSVFKNVGSYLPPGSFLFFNNTKVIPARLFFEKETGARIEIFLLSPVRPSTVISEAMAATGSCEWKCTIGNLKRWPVGAVLKKRIGPVALSARLVDRSEGIVELSWDAAIAFAELIDRSGETPLPPYLKRNAETADKDRYQTVYSRFEGAVAAPTAGLHFTPAVFDDLKRRAVGHDFLTLHVSAGTFQPVKTENADEHIMHREQVVVTRQNIENILAQLPNIIAVGTTSLRTLESLYWFGCKLLLSPDAEFFIGQDEPYQQRGNLPAVEQAIRAVLALMERSGKETLIGETAIYIKPGYSFQVCRGLITNFHQPGSTLMLLVAAFVGEPWKRIYEEALNANYRFLSFGDSSLLLP